MQAVHRHIVVVQYAGDYAEAFWRLRAGGAENYAAQAYSLEAVAGLVAPGTSVTSVCCLSARAGDEVLPNGVRSIALGFAASVEPVRVARSVDALQPTDILLRTPMVRVLRAARRRAVPVVATFADSFLERGVRARLRHHLLVRELNHANVLVVGNHGRNACRNLVKIGVRPEKVLPWDWPQASSDLAPKPHPGGREWLLLYAGLLDRRKGVGDIVEALAILRRSGLRARLQCFGSGPVEEFRHLAVALGVADAVDFAGQATNATVCEAMRHADVVLVPSRHSYAEGLPLTIYEALRSRTPMVASDHPMFEGILVDGVSAMVFRAGDAGHLARSVGVLVECPATYESLSRNAQATWQELQISTRWADMVQDWLGPQRQPAPWPVGANAIPPAGVARGRAMP